VEIPGEANSEECECGFYHILLCGIPQLYDSQTGRAFMWRSQNSHSSVHVGSAPLAQPAQLPLPGRGLCCQLAQPTGDYPV